MMNVHFENNLFWQFVYGRLFSRSGEDEWKNVELGASFGRLLPAQLQADRGELHVNRVTQHAAILQWIAGEADQLTVPQSPVLAERNSLREESDRRA